MHLYANDFIPEPDDTWDKLPYFFHTYENIGRMRWKEWFRGKERYQTQMKNHYAHYRSRFCLLADSQGARDPRDLGRDIDYIHN
jgi:hypothetical protein